MRPRRALALSAFLTLAGLAMPPPVLAQSGELARADQLYQEARERLSKGDTEGACQRFGDAYKLAPGVGIALYLSDCYVGKGHLADAYALLREAQHTAETRQDPRADVARKKADALQAQIPTLVVKLAPGAQVDGLEVNVDGRTLMASELGAALPFDPGHHVVTASAPGHKSHDYPADLPKTQTTTTVTIAALESAPAGGGAMPTPAGSTPTPAATSSAGNSATTSPASPEQPSSPGSWQRTLGLVGMITGGTALAASGVFALLASSKNSSANNGLGSGGCNPEASSGNDLCTQDGLSQRSTALTFATVSTIGFFAGVVLGGGGAYLFFTAPKSGPQVAISPALTDRSGGLLLRGRF